MTKDSLLQHPLSKLFPAMPADEFRELVEDIRRQGVVEPIELLDGMVLDGWNRYSACQELGIACPSRPWSPPNGNGEDAAFQHVWARNALRRHLTAAQRVEIIAKLHPEEWAAAVPQPGGHSNSVGATERIAKESGLSRESIRMAKQLEREAPDLWQRATNGELSLTAANGLRLGRQVNHAQQERKIRQQKKQLEWNTHFVKEVIEKVDAIGKIGTDIHAGLTHGKFAPEAKRFIARRLDKAMAALTQAQEELRK
jgi:hypothetical protein